MWIGWLTTFLVGVHGVSYWLVWFLNGTWRNKALPCIDCNAKKRYKNFRNFVGALSMLLLFSLNWTSRASYRRHSYLKFYTWHHVIALAIIVSTSLHYEYFVSWSFVPLWLWMFSRTRSFLNKRKSKVLEVAEIVPGYIRIVIARHAANPGIDFGIGQFVYVKVPEISNFSWHPFR